MSSVIDKILAGISRYNKNPSSIQQVSLDVLEEVLNGDDIPDPTSPFIFLLEASAASTAAAISESESRTRKLYSRLAVSQNELYRHMSDKDYIDRFATPASAVIKLLLPLNQVKAFAVSNTENNIRSLVIPRNS